MKPSIPEAGRRSHAEFRLASEKTFICSSGHTVEVQEDDWQAYQKGHAIRVQCNCGKSAVVQDVDQAADDPGLL